MNLLKVLQGHGETNRNREIAMNEEGNFRVPTHQGKNDRPNNYDRFKNRPQFASNNHINDNIQNYQNRNGNNGYKRNIGNNQNRNNDYKRNERINQIQINNRRRKQEANHRSGIINSREQIPIKGNMRGRRGRIMRGGQRVRFSDLEGNDDRSDRSPSPDERSSGMDSVRDERYCDNRDMERDR
jgi:hypothetical protein